ncbi:MAG: DUF1853 family protein [Gammaproteobacteria bacterium]
MPTDPIFDSITTPQVRDLAWVIKSPVLLNAARPPHELAPAFEAVSGFCAKELIIDDLWCELQFQLHRNWLCDLDRSSQLLLDWLKPRRTHYKSRLGYYFESLVEFLLRRAFAHHVLVPHLQVKNQHRTLGEFDYLLADSNTQIVHHWEVAVKFYLHYQHADGRVLWYGPNPRDRLDIKLQHLFHHQLVLSLRPEAAEAFWRAGLGPVSTWPVLPRLFLKGYLFYPSNSDWRNHVSFPALSPHHLRGWWTYLDPFVIPRADEDRRWLYLPRLHWLAPAVSEESNNGLMNIGQLHSFCLDLLQRNQKPPLIAEMAITESGDWREESRGFVVPQYWPGINAKQ